MRNLLRPPPYSGFAVSFGGSDATEDEITVRLGTAAAGGGATELVYAEFGTEQALGFMPHRGENRRTRLAAAATWAPTAAQIEAAGGKVPSRRELFEQRKRQRRGKMKR